jgi:hypothetical protein
VNICSGFVKTCPRFVNICPGFVKTCPRFVKTCPRFVKTCPEFVNICPGFVNICPGFVKTCPRFVKTCPRFVKTCSMQLEGCFAKITMYVSSLALIGTRSMRSSVSARSQVERPSLIQRRGSILCHVIHSQPPSSSPYATLVLHQKKNTVIMKTTPAKEMCQWQH